MRRPEILPWLLLAAVALVAVPLRSDGGAACDNATTSLASTINDPIAGDEKFFTLPVGPSNVMFLLDCSGSMDSIPQCGDGSAWGDNSALATCKWPTWPTFNAPTTAGAIAGDGTCEVSGNSNLAWMLNYTPTATLVDPGHGVGTNGLVDQPTWGTGCTGNNCLFQWSDDPVAGAASRKVYAYSSWTETSATPLADPCTVVSPVTWTDTVCNGTSTKTVPMSQTYTLPNCNACLTDANAKGFYFYKSWTAAYTQRTATVSGGKCTETTKVLTKSGGGTATILLSGGWLNANPPKFMSARKVIKDVAWIDPNVSATTDHLRLGLSYLSSNITNGAAIIVPLGPSAANSYPPNPAAYVTARQAIFDALNHMNGTSVGWKSGVSLPALQSGGTPMATGYFHVAQYFTQTGTYTSKFGSSTYELPAFAQTSKGAMNVSWVDGTTSAICWSCQKSAMIIVTDGSPNSEMTFPTSIQNYDNNVYISSQNCGSGGTTTNVTSCSTTSTLSKCCSPSDDAKNAPSRLPRIASYWLTSDLSPTALNGSQTLTTSAVSFGLPVSNARNILQATANMGGGIYNNAADGAALAAGVAQAVAQVSGTSTSFGAPAATALTTINAVDTKAFITRFKPNQKPTWEGHLLQWMLFDSAAAGCDPSKKYDPDDPNQQVECRGKTVSANFDGTTTSEGYNVCTKSFLVDAECDEVREDSATGLWYKKGSGNKPASEFWDAGEVLSSPTKTGYRTAAEHADAGNIAPYTTFAPGKTPRNLWTALPDGTMLELETKNAKTLAPYMNLDSAFCASFESLAKLCGSSPLPSCPVTNSGDWQTYCAQQIILFARGWDVLDQDTDGCAGPGNPSNGTGAASNTIIDGATKSCVISGTSSGEERDRQNDGKALSDLTRSQSPSFYKLGDIFHSAPVLVHPPTAESTCKLGMDNQCVRTIFGWTDKVKYALTTGYQTPIATYAACKSGLGEVDAYRAWRTDQADRQNVALVGSNDGFLHAFDAGGPNKDTSIDGNKQDVDCVWPLVKDGTGEELWGLLPPDLLPRLRDTLFNHQYMVDGNIMVRDIWVDGAAADGSTNNPAPGTGNALDGLKQKNEFRTVVIFGERSGGTQFTALDVTSAFSTDPTTRPRPTFRWSFPPPRSDDAQYMAQSWSDFSPRPPPVGPVRLKKAAGDPDSPAPAKGKDWIEKWVVMLNGGYDPTLTRGRAVWTVDAWTGEVYWRYTNADFKTNVVGSAANTTTSMFPVPAGIGMIDIGDPSVGVDLDSDNFFDTATWGDLGGNLFVARFDTPGVRGANGRVTNWRAARTFEQARTSTDTQVATNRAEFFYMTSNAFELQRHTLRTLIGSGNREQILEQGQGCGPDNLMSCCQAGCAVSTTSKLDYGACNSSATFACSSTGQMTSPALTQGCGTSGASACTGGTSNQFAGASTYSMSCGTSVATAGGSVTCDSAGLCTVSPVGSGHDLTPSNATTCAKSPKFFQVWAYGGLLKPQKAFSTDPTQDYTSSGAITFDQNRFTDAANFTKAGLCTFTPGGTCSLKDTTQAKLSAKGVLSCLDGSDPKTCQANVDDPGWFYRYNVTCPTELSCGSGCNNEKTASGSAITNSCATWNSFLPKGSAASGSDPCQGAQTAQQSAIAYSSDYVSGVPDLNCNQGTDKNADVVYRGAQRSTIAPPAAPMARNSVTRGGKIYYSTLQLDPGSPASSSSSGTGNVAAPLYRVEIPRDMHECRHTSAATTDKCL